ncbi:MAG: host attachment protein [Candidatus Sedimenticola sp. (ex Thyasira tokunagai)]
MSLAWVVVADSSQARIFSVDKPTSSLEEIHTLNHPEGRLHQGDLVSDRPGRDRNAGTGSHDMGHEADAKNEAAVRFAAQVDETLECGRTNGRFNRLYVVASPSFLGMLRKQQSSSLQKMVTGEISKNLASHDISDIRKNLPKRL